MKPVELFKEIDTNQPVIKLNKQLTFRETMIFSGIVTEGKNKNWGHKIVKKGYYNISAEGNAITLTPVIPTKNN